MSDEIKFKTSSQSENEDVLVESLYRTKNRNRLSRRQREWKRRRQKYSENI